MFLLKGGIRQSLLELWHNATQNKIGKHLTVGQCHVIEKYLHAFFSGIKHGSRHHFLILDLQSRCLCFTFSRFILLFL